PAHVPTISPRLSVILVRGGPAHDFSSSHTYTRPTPARIHQQHAGRARPRTFRRPCGSGTAAAHTGDVRAGGAPACSQGAVSGLTRTKPRLPRGLLGTIRVGRARRDAVRPRRRIPAGRRPAPVAVYQGAGSRTGRAASRIARQLREGRPGVVPHLLHPRRTRGTGDQRPRPSSVRAV